MKSLSEMQTVLRESGWKPVSSAGRFMELAGPLWAAREGDGWVYGIVSTDDHLNPAGVVHGGLLEALIDHALCAVAWEATGRTPCVTVQLDTHFLAPVRPGVLIEARGHVVRRTSSLVFLRGTLTVDEREVLVAQAITKINCTNTTSKRI